VARALCKTALLLSVPQLVKRSSLGYLAAEAIGAGGIAPVVAQEGNHGVHHFGRDARGGVVVKIIDFPVRHKGDRGKGPPAPEQFTGWGVKSKLPEKD
jgi:hypothetical protein